MSEYRDPTAVEVRNFLEIVEGNPSGGIYYDTQNIATHGYGIVFEGKNDFFIKEYINALNESHGDNIFNPNQKVEHYVYNAITQQWEIESAPEENWTLLDEIKWLSNSDNRKYKPFESNNIPDIIKLKTNSTDNAYAFDKVVYEAFLGKSGKNYGFNGVKDLFYDNVWDKLNSDERISLYSVLYNGRWNTRIRDAIKLYTSNGMSETSSTLSDSQFIGKITAWLEILYYSNNLQDRPTQNRSFIDANKFLGITSSSYSSKITVSNYREANIAISIMNLRYTSIVDELKSIEGSDYASNPNKYIRDNFSNAVSVFLIDTLFTEWNLYTDLQINTSTGTTSYGDVTGSDKRDLIFITGEQDGTTVHADAGDDVLSSENGNDLLVGGTGDDYLFGGEGDDIYIYNLGDGNDYISDDGGNDKIVFGEGITLDDLSFRKDNWSPYSSTVYIDINKTGNNIEIYGQLSEYNNYTSKIETLEFADGTSVSMDSLTSQLIQAMNSFGADTSSTMDAPANLTENVSDMCNLAAGSDLIKKAI